MKVAKTGWAPIPIAQAVVNLCLAATPWPSPAAGEAFVNFESPQVHPLDLSPDGNTLAAVSSADNRLEIFDVTTGKPRHRASVSVGLDPVSVRFRTDHVAWVVNQISDSLSVVDTRTRRVVATLETLDEPADVIFAGAPERAFVTCAEANAVLVFDPDDLGAPPRVVAIEAEDPRALAVSPDGGMVYAAVFESGNGTTVLAGGSSTDNVVNQPGGPYGGQNPPPNRGDTFSPPIRADLPDPPRVALIVRKSDDGRWLDDNRGDWSAFVSGSQSGLSGRPGGWDLADRDVAVIDTSDLSVRYIRRLMNLCMAIAVHPKSGRVTVVGTEATNEIRFEPNLNGVFLRVNVALAHPRSFAAAVRDLNPHLDYRRPRAPRAVRERSLGDPRAVVWNAAGSRAYVAGMGSSNVVVLGADGRRLGRPPIEVGEGPTGLALDPDLDRLYVLNRFEASISVIDTRTEREIDRVRFFDPTPAVIRRGRRHLYDTHATSGLGHLSCASCHVDARFDRLAWDLGDPQGELKSQDGQNLSIRPNDAIADWHPMKGPMVTQTLQDVIGKEPFHWRGDRDGLEGFNRAFVTLQGDDTTLSRAEMQQLEDFLATIHVPPNPYREFDNSLPTALALPRHKKTGRFGGRGEPLPGGNAQRAFDEMWRNPLHSNTCISCHSLPTGAGTPQEQRPRGGFAEIPPGPNGEEHLALIGDVGESLDQFAFKIPQMRNLHERVGYTHIEPISLAGFGYIHDGTVPSLENSLSGTGAGVSDDQQVADLIALVLSFSGGFDIDSGPTGPPGAPSRDAHAAVGRQVTISGPGQQAGRIDAMIELARQGAVELVVKGIRGGRERGWLYRRADGRFRPDQAGRPALGRPALESLASPAARLTFTLVPAGSGVRIGIDRDLDGVLDFNDKRAGELR